MLYREIIAVCSEIHTKHINAVCGQNVELLTVKPGGNHWTLKGHKTPVIFSYILCSSSFTNRRSSSHNVDSYKTSQPHHYPSTISVQKIKWPLCLRNLDTRWKWMLRFTPRPLVPSPSQNRILLLSNWRLSGPLSPRGRSGEWKNLLLQGIEFSIPYPSHCTDWATPALTFAQ